MPKFHEHHNKGSQWCKINTDLFYFLSVTLSLKKKMEGITNEAVNKEQQAQNFENLKMILLEISYLTIQVSLIYTFITLIFKI